ncbi:MAG: hypothetical protein ACREJU_15060 [Nitrospiraceae bacterium]
MKDADDPRMVGPDKREAADLSSTEVDGSNKGDLVSSESLPASTTLDRQVQAPCGKSENQRKAFSKSKKFSPFFLSIVCFVVVGILLEGVSRLYYYVHWGNHLYGIQHNEYSLRLGWSLAPGTYRYFHVNDQGFRRTNNVSLVPSNDTIRIFLVGGSTAFGSNGLYPQVDVKPLYDQDTIDYQLQLLLKTRHPGSRFEVINAAVSEYRLFQEMTLFREKLVNFHPDLVIFLDGHNDISALTEGAALVHESAPYWKNRHFQRGQRVLNESSPLGPLLYLDIYLGRASYLYYGMTVLHQRIHEIFASHGGVPTVIGDWGDSAFRPSEEKALRERYERRLKELDTVLHLYLDLVNDLKVGAARRNIKIVYGLQPQIVVEEPSNLSKKDQQIQQIAFQHQRDFGSLSWRYLTSKISSRLTKESTPNFRFVDLVTIAKDHPGELYTDYCHLTAEGNRIVAERLYPIVAAMIGLQPLHSDSGTTAS